MTNEPLPQGPEARQIANVPVFNCHVYISPPNEVGQVTARAASLADLVVEGTSEREALRNIVAQFKQVVGECLKRGEEIPWLSEPLVRHSDESQRFVPVHF